MGGGYEQFLEKVHSLQDVFVEHMTFYCILIKVQKKIYRKSFECQRPSKKLKLVKNSDNEIKIFLQY